MVTGGWECVESSQVAEEGHNSFKGGRLFSALISEVLRLLWRSCVQVIGIASALLAGAFDLDLGDGPETAVTTSSDPTAASSVV
eukprot:2321046-Ditylum_brightwellii.AAC.1